MVFDDYDMKIHGKTDYDKTINVYREDNIKDVIDNFSKENNIDVNWYQSKEMTEQIQNIRNMYNVLDHRYITLISFRIIHFNDKGEIRWFIIHVWR